MKGHNYIVTLIIFLVPSLIPLHVQGDVCKDVKCGEGTCVPYNSSILGFDCVCYGGWKKIQLGPFTFPACLIPNCTVDPQCSGAPPPPSSPPPPNPLDPCFLVWCNDGECVANGTNHSCKCNQGSTNLFNDNTLACFPQCAFGLDCSGLGLGPHQSSPPPPPPSNGTLASPPPNGSNKNSKGWRSFAWNAAFTLFEMILALAL